MDSQIAAFIDSTDDENDSDNDDNENNNDNDIDLMNPNSNNNNDNSNNDNDDNNENDSSKRIVRAEDMMAEMLSKTKEELSHLPSVTIENESSLSYDLGNMTVYDSNNINSTKMPNVDVNNSAIMNNLNDRKSLNESYLISMSRNNTQSLINQLFKLPVRNDKGNEGASILVQLPPPRTRLPREKPLPMEKPLTRWEKFAARKNIRHVKKTSNNALTWDDDKQEWRKKWGYKKANNEMDDVIFEHKQDNTDRVDPWTKMKNEKKKRIAINEENRMFNLQAAIGDRLDGTVDLQSAIKYSKLKRKKGKTIPMNSQTGNIKPRRQSRQENKFNFSKFGHLNKSLEIAQHSTASMGKYDKLNKNEMKPTLKRNVIIKEKVENKLQERHGGKSGDSAEESKQKEILFQIFGKESRDAFNVQKASKQAKIGFEIKRSRKRKRR